MWVKAKGKVHVNGAFLSSCKIFCFYGKVLRCAAGEDSFCPVLILQLPNRTSWDEVGLVSFLEELWKEILKQ